MWMITTNLGQEIPVTPEVAAYLVTIGYSTVTLGKPNESQTKTSKVSPSPQS